VTLCWLTRLSYQSLVFNIRLIKLTFFIARSSGLRNIRPQSLYLLQESAGQRHGMWRLSSLFSPHNLYSFCSTNSNLYKWPLRDTLRSSQFVFLHCQQIFSFVGLDISLAVWTSGSSWFSSRSSSAPLSFSFW